MIKCFMVGSKYYENSIKKINDTENYTINNIEKLNDIHLILRKYINNPIEDFINKLAKEGIELRFK